VKAVIEKSQLGKLATVADITKSQSFGGSLYVRLTAADGKLSIFASDGLVQASFGVEADCSDGDICVGGALFSRAVSSLPDGRVEVISEGTGLQIRSGRSKFTLPTANPDQVGLVAADGEFSASAEVSGTELLALIKQLVPMAARKTTSGPGASNPAINGIHFSATSDGLTCAATDSYRIGIREVEAKVSGTVSVSVPVQGLQLLTKYVENDDVAKIELSEHAARLTVGGMVVHSRVLEGTFPSYGKHITALGPSHQTITSSRAGLIETLTRTGLFTTGFTPAKAQIGPVVTFNASEKDSGESEQELESVEFSGEPMTCWVNPHLLLDAVRACDFETVKIIGHGNTRPLLVESDTPASFVALVMLVRPPAGS